MVHVSGQRERNLEVTISSSYWLKTYTNEWPKPGKYVVLQTSGAKQTENFDKSVYCVGDTLLVAQLVEALRYMPEGRGLDSRCYH